MSSRIVIEIDKDDLNRESWAFWLNGYELQLDSYSTLSRKTKRHHFKKYSAWNRIERMCGSHKKIDRPIVSEDLYKQAINSYIRQIKILDNS